MLLTEELIFNKIEPLLQLFRTALLMDKFSRNRSIVKLCQTGQLTQAQIAQSFEISQGRVSQLYHQFQVAGEAGLVVKPTPGAPAKLTKEQRAQLPDLLSRGAESYGFEGEVWTRARVGEVIRQQFGVTYEVSTVGLLLKELGFTLQKPIRRDYRQNPQSVTQWQEEILPELKKTAAEETRVVLYIDESAFYLLPQLRQTWAPAGQTPVLSESCQYTHLSVISAISPAGEIYYQLQKTSYTSSDVLHFLQDLLLYFQQPLLILWDGASIHQSKEIKKWLRTHNFDGRVQLARLPAYSPQLNAAEQVWAWLKGGQLKNVCCKTLEELTQVVQKAFEKLTANTAIIQKFFEHPEVAYY
jgi:transposase